MAVKFSLLVDSLTEST